MLHGQLVEVDAVDDAPALAERLQQDARRGHGLHLRYAQGERHAARWAELAGDPGVAAQALWKHGGVYLISGGAGGLGLLVAEEIARQARSATLVLTGRSALDAMRLERLRRLQVGGCRVVYRRIDVANRDAVAGLIDGLVAEHGKVDGIVHCAGVTRDSFLVNKTAQQLHEVFEPKVTGLLNLDEASRGLALGCFILFSSLAGALGNVGQADYAAANGFMDAYARHRNSLVAMQRRHGRTLSINWPLWADGGLRPDAATEQLLMQRSGLAPLGHAAAFEALYRAWASGENQVLVLHGPRDRVLGAWGVVPAGTAIDGAPAAAQGAPRAHAGAAAREAGAAGRETVGAAAIVAVGANASMSAPVSGPTNVPMNAVMRPPMSPPVTARMNAPMNAATSAPMGASMTAAAGAPQGATPAAPPVALAAPVDPAGEAALRDRTVRYFKQPAERIDASELLERYGIDSVMVMALTAQLERSFGPLSKTLFFEHQTIGALSAHFLRLHRAPLLRLLGADEREGPAAAAGATAPRAPRVRAGAR